MKTIFTSLLLIVSFYARSQNNDTINKYNSKKQKTGKWIVYNEFEGDSIKTICNYRNGALDGQVNTYFPNDRLQNSIKYVNGVKQGISKSYYKSGAISDVFIFDKGATIFHLKFDPQGKIFQEFDGNKLI